MHGAEVTERKSDRFGEASRPDSCSPFQAHHALVSNRLHLGNPFTFSSLEVWGMTSSEAVVFGYSYNLYCFSFFILHLPQRERCLLAKKEQTLRKNFWRLFEPPQHSLYRKVFKSPFSLKELGTIVEQSLLG